MIISIDRERRNTTIEPYVLKTKAQCYRVNASLFFLAVRDLDVESHRHSPEGVQGDTSNALFFCLCTRLR